MIQASHVVVFFPTFGRLEPDGQSWQVPIRGWIYEPRSGGPARRMIARLLRRALGFHPNEQEKAIFRERTRAFLAANQRGQRIVVRLGQETFALKKSNARGHFAGLARMSLAPSEGTQPSSAPADWVSFQAVAGANDERVFGGRVCLVPEAGVSVLSDIDDTIKVSEVGHLKALLANTFLRELRPVPGMGDLYRSWAKDGATFHYVSSSPWQLYTMLAEFIETNGIPAGTFHLKTVRWKDKSVLSLLASPERFKHDEIEPILRTFPRRRFILVGDSGEKDPEIYADLARHYPQQVARVLIRDVTGDRADGPRYRACFHGLSRQSWQVFQDGKEIETAVREVRP
jgi:phosphatidate phosphatase APP1